MDHESAQNTPQFLPPGKYPAPFLSRPPNRRPESQSTEIYDTDFESEYDNDFDSFDESPRASMAADSVTTLSSYRDLRTPDSHLYAEQGMGKDGITVRGPSGPHLFRASMDSNDFKSTMEVGLVLAKTPTTGTFPQGVMKLQPAPPPKNPRTLVRNERIQPKQIDEATVQSWSPADVALWMKSQSMDETLVEKFLVNDITGSILLELRNEDLKELEIHSFGKRRTLMNSIQSLRNSVRLSTGSYRPSSASASGEESWTSEDERTSSTSHQLSSRIDESWSHHENDELKPSDSVSIVAIEQLIPKQHNCSKGENCRKWQRQQQMLARITNDLPKESVNNGNVILAGDPGNPHTAPNLMSYQNPPQKPSLSSSDAFCPPRSAGLGLSKETLNVVRPRDTQESIRQYLDFQRLSQLNPVDDPVSPPEEVSANSFRESPSLSDNLRTLPKLTIPNAQEQPSNFSGLKTITPSVLQNRPGFHQQQQFYPYDQMTSPGNFYRISDDYRADDIYRQGTPFSEMDAPVTAIPAGPIARDMAQSVPPDMRFGREDMVPNPTLRSASVNEIRQRKAHPQIDTKGLQSLGRVEEGKVAVIDGPEDLYGTGLFPRTANDLAHSGWMKKRKTTRLLRHEWEDHHFTLKGTQLSMFENEWASRRESRALECIDVDDYAVACSSLASSSKLSAAFKKNVLKRNNNATDESAFAFSLIPSKDKDSTVDKKAFFLNAGKSHHFAVKTRDERIDWMRELMLAKALKRGRQGGELMEVNGNMI